MLARPILTLPCISLEDYVFSASGRHKQGGPDFGRGLYLFSRLSWRLVCTPFDRTGSWLR